MSKIFKSLAKLSGQPAPASTPAPQFRAGAPGMVYAAPKGSSSKSGLVIMLGLVIAIVAFVAKPFGTTTRVPASPTPAEVEENELFDRNHAAVNAFYQGDLATSEADLRSLLMKRPGEASLHANLGAVLRREGKLPDARTAYGEALRLEPTNAVALNGMGQVYLQEGEYKEAEVSFERSLAAAPQRLDTLLHLGEAAERQGQWATASVHYLRYLRSAPTDDRFRPALARRLAQLRHHDDEPRKGEP